MRVLVSTASKHGSTADIGRAIADALSGEEIEARIAAPEEVTGLDGYDAVILGSAVYAGRWMKTMRELTDRLGEELASRPVWLFSSGPIGNPPMPEEDPVDVAPILEKTNARDHFLFAGKLDRQTLSFGERAIVGALKAPEGDFRDWDDIRRRALAIAAELKTLVQQRG
ncbi:MAG TPA: flavodoxin domain-containing protein [Acidimicrobiia bacterium]|nr:flavodoxin domain-containing protein [Acidimicrobiia bacterium]